MDFLKVVPTVWDDTRVLEGVVAEHLVMARRSGNDWYLGALTGTKSRDIAVNLGFLGKGRWTVRLWKDADDSQTNAEHLAVEERIVTSSDTLNVRLAPSGGCVGRFQLHKQADTSNSTGMIGQ